MRTWSRFPASSNKQEHRVILIRRSVSEYEQGYFQREEVTTHEVGHLGAGRSGPYGLRLARHKLPGQRSRVSLRAQRGEIFAGRSRTLRYSWGSALAPPGTLY